MKTYEVTIRATITKTYTVKADSKEDADSKAHEVFTVVMDGVEEKYEQDTISETKEVKQ